jgi:uncharacterized protein (DUF2252 family)
VGDLHVENFGTWRDSRGRPAWGINDFDEAGELPFTNDLVRLATSVVLAANAVRIEAPIEMVCELLLTGYGNGLQAGGLPIFLENEQHQELRAMAKTGLEPPEKFWAKRLNDDDNPKIEAKKLPEGLPDIFTASVPRRSELIYREQKKPGGLGGLGACRI